MAENKSKEERQNQILESALHIFVVKGYSETRMDDIAEDAGLSKGALYHHYESKNELFFALVDYWEESFLPEFFNKKFNGTTASDILRELSTEIAENFRNKKFLFLAELEFWALSNRDEKVRKRTQRLYIRMLNFLKLIFIKAEKSGEYKNVDPGMAAMAVMTVMQGVMWFSIFDPREFTAEEFLNEVTEFMIHGFQKVSMPVG